MGNNGGDVLARGGVRATFKPAEVSQAKWNSIFGEESAPKFNNSEPVEEPKKKKHKKKK
jgi:hypothetical protein